MKIFCSYAFTGEDELLLRQRMQLVVDAIEELGHTAYCYHFSPVRTESTTPKQAMGEAFKRLQEHDLVLVILSSDRRSEGMLLEIGAAMVLGKPVIVAVHESSINKTYLPELVDDTIQWASNEDLVAGIQSAIARYKIT